MRVILNDPKAAATTCLGNKRRETKAGDRATADAGL